MWLIISNPIILPQISEGKDVQVSETSCRNEIIIVSAVIHDLSIWRKVKVKVKEEVVSAVVEKWATGKAGNGKRKREREREAGTGKDHRWCAKRHRYDVGRLKTH